VLRTLNYSASTLVIHGIGLLAMSLVVWVVGPVIAVSGSYLLESNDSRILAISTLLVIWALKQIQRYVAAKNNNDQMIRALATDDRSDIQAETSVITSRFEESLKILKDRNKATKGGKGQEYLYELPWYIIIGPPGSGKTTALVNSGLNFPLKDHLGTGSLHGIGGTRHCDWWFTNEAVLIDTAGRFTTQDSHESVDKAAWERFMDLLKKYRKARPINGALVTMSLADIMQQKKSDRLHYARTIRYRIDELTENLGIKFPVYFMFTKCDLVCGFNEFFEQFHHADRMQVWGETFALDESGRCAIDMADYPQHLDQLVERLDQQLLVRVHEEKDRDNRVAILGFSSQIASLKRPISNFLNEIFASGRDGETPLLRGVYYTSGTQAGTPIDRLLGNMASTFGFDPTSSAHVSGRGKSFFIHNLLRDVIFPESEIAGVDQRILARRKWLRLFGYGAAIAALVAGTIVWMLSYAGNRIKVSEAIQLADLSRQAAYSQPMDGADFLKVAAEMDYLRQTASVFADSGALLHAGLFQGDSVTPAAEGVYLRVLETKLLPVIIARLEEMIIDINNVGEIGALYVALKAYLMYAGMQPGSDVGSDNEFLLELSRADWQRQYASNPDVVDQLVSHHRYLLTHGFESIDPKSAIVNQARQTLAHESLAQQVYQSVKLNLLQDHSMDLSLDLIAGRHVNAVFESRIGSNLTTFTIPGMFTRAGFYEQFKRLSLVQTREYLENSWVLFDQDEQKEAIGLTALQDDIYQLYYDDFIKRWSNLLKDLKVRQTTDYQTAVTQLDLAFGTSGPIERIVRTVAEQTRLSTPISSTADAGSGSGTQDDGAGKRISTQVNRVVLSTSRSYSAENTRSELGGAVEAHFEPYYNIIQSATNEPLLDRLVDNYLNLSVLLERTLLNEYSSRSALDAVSRRLQANERDLFALLQAQTSFLPSELRSWVGTFNRFSWNLVMRKARDELNTLWRREIFDDYNSAVAGRYPISEKAALDLELYEFTSFFAPGGRIDRFVDNHLKGFINTRSSSWQEKPIDGQVLGLEKDTLTQLHDAKQISRVFFTKNTQKPYFTFIVRPVRLDESVTRLSLSLGESRIQYTHGAAGLTRITWPPKTTNESRIEFLPRRGVPVYRSERGLWAMYRLLDSGRFERNERGSAYDVTLERGGFETVLELRVEGGYNPLGERLLQNFRLPEQL